MVLPTGNKIELESAEFTVDGKYVISESGDDEIIIYDVKSGKEIKKINLPHQSRLNTVKVKNYSPNGKLVIISPNFSSETNLIDTAVIVDLNNGIERYLELSSLSSNWHPIVYAVFSSDGRHIIISNLNKSVVFNLSNLEKVIDFSGKSSFSPDGKMVLTLLNDNTLIIWDIIKGQETKIAELKEDKIKDAKFSPNGKYLTITFYNNVVKIWDPELNKIVKTFGEIADFDNLDDIDLHSQLEEKDPQEEIDGKTKFSHDMKQLLILNDKEIIVCNFEKSNIQKVIKNESEVNYVKNSPDGKLFLSFIDNKIAKIYDYDKLNEVFSFFTENIIWKIEFSFDGEFLIISVSNKVKIYNIVDGKQLYELDGENFSLSPSGSLLVTKFNSIIIYDLKTGKEIKRIQKKALRTEKVIFTKDSKFIISSSWGPGIFETKTGRSENIPNNFDGSDMILYGIQHEYNIPIEKTSHDGKLKMKYLGGCFDIFDVLTEKIKHTIACSLFIRSAEFSLDGRLAVVAADSTHENYVYFIDIDSGKKLNSLKCKRNDVIQKAIVCPNNKYVLINYGWSCPTVYEISTGFKIFELCGHGKFGVLEALFLPNGKFIITTGVDNKTILWDAITGKEIYTRYMLDFSNWLVQLPNSPYYMCSKDASKMLHYVTPSLKVIGFEQLDPVYNRPDIVLDSIGKYFGNEDRGMIEEYRKAWEKRIERLGLKDQMDKLGKGEISVPNAEIENAATIAYENTDGIISLKIKANDPKYKLRRFNVWVNEVPMYGANGISIARLNKNNWDTTLSVPLSLGDNKIQVSVMNELGLENFKYPIYFNYKSKKIVPKTYFIGIAVDNFNNGKNLSFCVKDVEDLSNYFFKLPNSNVKLLTEKEVTKENITQLKEYLQKTSVHDRVIISCNSHGLLDSTRNFYLATHDTDFDSPNLNGISYEMLDGLLDDIPARKKLLLLDACNSGENDEGYAKIDNSSNEGRGVNVVIGDEIVKESNFKKMNELFVNVRNNSGAYIISATGGIQKALEGEAVMLDGKPLENGSFTYAVLEYLKENESNTTKLTVNQLKKYVEQRVVELTSGKQTPTSRQETMEIDWDLR
jgi:WD40 repeat protein